MSRNGDNEVGGACEPQLQGPKRDKHGIRRDANHRCKTATCVVDVVCWRRVRLSGHLSPAWIEPSGLEGHHVVLMDEKTAVTRRLRYGRMGPRRRRLACNARQSA